MLNRLCSMEPRCSAGCSSEQDLFDRAKPSEIMSTSSSLDQSMICEQSKSGRLVVHICVCVTSISDSPSRSSSARPEYSLANWLRSLVERISALAFLPFGCLEN
jgi:hypothetical protein